MGTNLAGPTLATVAGPISPSFTCSCERKCFLSAISLLVSVFVRSSTCACFVLCFIIVIVTFFFSSSCRFIIIVIIVVFFFLLLVQLFLSTSALGPFGRHFARLNRCLGRQSADLSVGAVFPLSHVRVGESPPCGTRAFRLYSLSTHLRAVQIATPSSCQVIRLGTQRQRANPHFSSPTPLSAPTALRTGLLSAVR